MEVLTSQSVWKAVSNEACIDARDVEASYRSPSEPGHGEEKRGGNSPPMAKSQVLSRKNTHLDDIIPLHVHSSYSVEEESLLAYRTSVLMDSKFILHLLHCILITDFGLDFHFAAGSDPRPEYSPYSILGLPLTRATLLRCQYIFLAIVTMAITSSLFLAAWTLRRQGHHRVVYWSCLPLLILTISWTNFVGSIAKLVLIQLPLFSEELVRVARVIRLRIKRS